MIGLLIFLLAFLTAFTLFFLASASFNLLFSLSAFDSLEFSVPPNIPSPSSSPSLFTFCFFFG